MSSPQELGFDEDRPWRTRPPAQAPERGATRTERLALVAVARAMGRPAVRFELWNGEVVFEPEGRAVAAIRFLDRGALWRFVAAPERGFANGYVDGSIAVQGSLTNAIAVALRSTRRWGTSRFGGGRFRRRRAHPGGATAEARARYDLGPDFFRIWLDEQLVDSSGYFERPTMTLEEAQVANLDHVCQALGLRSGVRMVEARSGWGALALHAARFYGATVRAYEASPQRVQWARERAQQLGVAKHVQFVAEDWRSIEGEYDAFVSTSALDDAGRRDRVDLRRVIDRCLAPGGRGLLRFIGRSRAARPSPWLEREIFPHGDFPSLRQVLEVLEPVEAVVHEVENLRTHHAQTLERWLMRFEEAAPELESRFDPAFARAWRLYLAGALAAFQVGSCELFQITFGRPAPEALLETPARVPAAVAGSPGVWMPATS